MVPVTFPTDSDWQRHIVPPICQVTRRRQQLLGVSHRLTMSCRVLFRLLNLDAQLLILRIALRDRVAPERRRPDSPSRFHSLGADIRGRQMDRTACVHELLVALHATLVAAEQIKDPWEHGQTRDATSSEFEVANWESVRTAWRRINETLNEFGPIPPALTSPDFDELRCLLDEIAELFQVNNAAAPPLGRLPTHLLQDLREQIRRLSPPSTPYKSAKRLPTGATYDARKASILAEQFQDLSVRFRGSESRNDVDSAAALGGRLLKAATDAGIWTWPTVSGDLAAEDWPSVSMTPTKEDNFNWQAIWYLTMMMMPKWYPSHVPAMQFEAVSGSPQDGLGVWQARPQWKELAENCASIARFISSNCVVPPVTTVQRPIGDQSKLAQSGNVYSTQIEEDLIAAPTIEQLECNTPRLDETMWAKSNQLRAHSETASTKSLGEQRSRGRKSADGNFGVCEAGRIWRKKGRAVWYFIPSLLPVRDEAHPLILAAVRLSSTLD